MDRVKVGGDRQTEGVEGHRGQFYHLKVTERGPGRSHTQDMWFQIHALKVKVNLCLRPCSQYSIVVGSLANETACVSTSAQ